MTQCNYVAENGEQCSNRAIPGTTYCKAHSSGQTRIQFRPVTKPAPAPAPTAPPEKTTARTKRPPAPPTWTAHPSTAVAPPTFSGLQRDGRGVLVAPQGCLWLAGIDNAAQRTPLAARLAQLLANLSQALTLWDHVQVQRLPDAAGALVMLTPATAVADLAPLYDVASTAADFCGGLLYIGQANTFIQYRDAGAPHGYDAAAESIGQPPATDHLYLIDRAGTHPIPTASLIPAPLPELLLQMAPVPDPTPPAADQLFTLVDPALYRMVARYLRDHHLTYRVARFASDQANRALTLFAITPHPNSPGPATVPAFVRAYLAALPRAVVLTEQWADADRQLLVQASFRHPCQPTHMLGAFPPASLLLCTQSLDFPNLAVTPAPTWFDGEALATMTPPRAAQLALTPRHDQETLPLTLPLRLAPATGPTPATAALLLDAQEVSWLRRLLYRLPGAAFAAYRLCLGQTHAVLVSETLPIENLPFGLPLRRHQDTQLFLPLSSRLLPELSWSLLAAALQLAPDHYTFLTLDQRLDLPQHAFVPLARALMADPKRPRVNFAFQAAPTLPTLHWKAPAPLPTVPTERPSTPLSEPTAPPPGLLERLIGRRKPESTSPSTAPATEPVTGAAEAPPYDLHQQAAAYLAQEDYLSAALCYHLAGAHDDAARCYQTAARSDTP